MKKIIATAAVTAALLSACASNGSGSAGDLQGSWQLRQLNGQAVPTDVQRPNIIRFEGEGNKFNAYAGCNNLFGLYQKSGNALSFNAIASTRMACADEGMQRDQAVQAALQATSGYRHQGDVLVLHDAAGKALAQFQKM